MRHLVIAAASLVLAGCPRPQKRQPTTPKERLVACCVEGCINDSGGEDFCTKACEDELATHPNELRSHYCPDFKP